MQPLQMVKGAEASLLHNLFLFSSTLVHNNPFHNMVAGDIEMRMELLNDPSGVTV